ncbi:ABC-2 type transporter [Acidothermus cellulolyticus 11B]|jgi:ABC-2 type transport system permease protein/oleandomycin transport system permease protein|uniref:Transport permease protein n=1 Tax=Acidothermus cellulolyticus (strain ATCC 43068 / DSM 8971 / 11B) TaxID=351607 RepID=A0LRQ4_ACIC1|nr:ABC transporter permease [Acidothermus cellulolyticus]ABK52114.1 ABC-2 type transporter [Acidothermus cellulolyticus 11B]
MSAVSTVGAHSLRRRISWAVADAATLTRRNLLVWWRVPAFLVFTVVQPVMFTLLFRYVFGGAISTGGRGSYVDYLMPGIIGQTAAFASIGTAIALGNEAGKGIIDRFRSMPMARSAVLAGRLAADTLRMLFTILVILGVGYLVGFRFHNGVAGAIGMVLLAGFFGLTICAVSAYIGLAIKDEESIQAFGLIWLFPLTFVSSAFVPINSMPGWLQAFANNQPVTIVINTLRYLALGPTPGASALQPHLWQSLAWLVGILAVFGPLAVRAYRRLS